MESDKKFIWIKKSNSDYSSEIRNQNELPSYSILLTPTTPDKIFALTHFGPLFL